MSEITKEAVERLELITAKAAHLIRWTESDAHDLAVVLSAIQVAREALDVFSKVGRLIDGPFGPGRVPDDGVFQSGCAWREGDQKRTLTWGDFRRAAEVSRALSPGGADE